MSTTIRPSVPMDFPAIGQIEGSTPIIVIGPNGVGKSRLMRRLVPAQRFVSAQRRTYLEEQLPTWRAEQAKKEIKNQVSSAHSHPWQWSSEIDAMFARLLSEHYAALYANNEAAKAGGSNARAFVNDTIMDRLMSFWQSVFVGRRLSFEDFSPTVARTDMGGQKSYAAKGMSDGERSCLYMAARVLTAESGLLVIDEPELHMHRKLAIDYWNKLEEMRPDIRFVYVTHEIHFALSRRDPAFLIVRDEELIERVALDHVPSFLVEALLGAAMT